MQEGEEGTGRRTLKLFHTRTNCRHSGSFYVFVFKLQTSGLEQFSHPQLQECWDCWCTPPFLVSIQVLFPKRPGISEWFSEQSLLMRYLSLSLDRRSHIIVLHFSLFLFSCFQVFSNCSLSESSYCCFMLLRKVHVYSQRHWYSCKFSAVPMLPPINDIAWSGLQRPLKVISLPILAIQKHYSTVFLDGGTVIFGTGQIFIE